MTPTPSNFLPPNPNDNPSSTSGEGLSIAQESTQSAEIKAIQDLEAIAAQTEKAVNPQKGWQTLGLKKQVVIIAILLSALPLLIVGSLSLYITPSITTLLIGSSITAIIAGLIADRLTKRALMPVENAITIVHQMSGNEKTDFAHHLGNELSRLGINLKQLSGQLQQLSQQQTKLTQQRQLFSLIAYRTRQTPTPETLYETTVQGAREFLETDRVVIYRFNPDWSGTMIAESVAPEYPKVLHETIGDPCFRERHARQYLNGRTRAINDIYTEPGLTDCHIRLLEQYRIKANLVVPIRHDKGLFGLLIAHQCSNPRIWQKSDLDFLSGLSAEIEYSLDYITFVQRQQAETKRAWFFGDIAFRAHQSPKDDELFQFIVQNVRQFFKADRVLVYRFNPDWSGHIIAESVASEYPKVLDETIDDPCFRDRYVELYRTGRVHAINNIRTEPSLTECHIRTLEKYEVKANLVAPLRQDKELIGLLIVHQCSRPRAWKKSEIEFISQLSLQLEYALDHLSFIEKIQATAGRSRLFGDIAFRARQSVTHDKLLQVIVQGAYKFLKVDRVLVYQFNPDWSGTMITEAVGKGWSSVLDEKIDDPCFHGRYVDLYRNGRVRAINDIYQEPGLTDCHIRTLEQYEVKANLIAPIRRENQLFALLIAHQCDNPRIWQKSEIEFFSELATQAEYALDHLNFIEKLKQARQTAETASGEQRQQKEAIQQQLDRLLQDVHSVFNGDLTVRATLFEGEIGRIARFLNDTMENLQKIVVQVQTAAGEVMQTAKGSADEIQSVSSEALQASEAITIALREIQLMAESIQGMRQAAQQAQLKVEEANQALQSGDEAMNQTVEGILTMAETVEETAQKVKRLGESSQKISRVVNLIRDLANQTHVLALNASIEANGPMKEGQGFSVVAEEVRSLSEQSKAALEEIQRILEEIQAETHQVINAMEKGREQVIAGTGLVEVARTKLTDIATVSTQIRQLVEAMAQAAIAQAQTSASVANTMQEVETIAQHTSEKSVAGAESFTQLLGVAQQLHDDVAQFKVK